MDAPGAKFDSDLGSGVDGEMGAAGIGQAQDVTGQPPEGIRVQVFLPELDESDAGVERPGQDLFEGARRACGAVDDEVEGRQAVHPFWGHGMPYP